MKTLDKSETNKLFEKSSGAAILSLFVCIMLMMTSIAQRDLRYTGVAIVLFSVGYTGRDTLLIGLGACLKEIKA